MGYKLNVLGGPFDIVTAEVTTAGNAFISQVTSDPAGIGTCMAWVLKSGGGGSVTGGGALQGILGMATYLVSVGSGGGSPTTYQFSYRTIEGTTIRVAMS